MNGEDIYWDSVQIMSKLYDTDFAEFIRQYHFLYENALQDNWPVSKLPIYLSLLYPRFTQNIVIIEHGWAKESNFCQYPRYKIDETCPPMRLGITEKKLAKDHAWPESLGGIKDPSNQMNLCDFHNTQKSNSIWKYDWNPRQIPSWIKMTLGQVIDQLDNRELK